MERAGTLTTPPRGGVPARLLFFLSFSFFSLLAFAVYFFHSHPFPAYTSSQRRKATASLRSFVKIL